MDLSDKHARVPVAEIQINRDERQRREIKVDDLLSSEIFRAHGPLNPIIIEPLPGGGYNLLAGERRLTAVKLLGHTDIIVRFVNDLSPVERQILELEENLKRQDLVWRDQVRSIQRIHQLYLASNVHWSQLDTAKAIGMGGPSISHYLRVAEEIDSPKIAQAQGINAAYNILARKDERAANDAIAEILETGVQMFEPKGQPTVQIQTPNSNPTPTLAKPKFKPAEDSILAENFLEWAPKYDGPKFNFIHCDFPYGINVFGGEQARGAETTLYSDSPDVYWDLIKCLGQNLDRLMAHSGHLLFWFSMEYYCQTMELFAKVAPSLDLQNFPLIWVKSDNVGILPDPKRGPRRIYETAFIASREDRPIIKAVSNAYSAPTDKAHHPSTKPEPVLRHFFQMFVDENTRMLDPTCGGGSALRAAESMGAKFTLGLEKEPEHCTNARKALRSFRALRAS